MNLTTTEIFILVAYGLACIVVSVVADQRGHDSGFSFLVSLLATPLIGAILYAPYAVNKTNKASSSKTVTVSDIPEANWSSEQRKLKQMYERGEITVEEYQNRWNSISK